MFISAVTDIDTSGIHALEELYRSLHKKDIQVSRTTIFSFFFFVQFTGL